MRSDDPALPATLAPPASATELLELLGRLPGVLDMSLGEVLHRLTDEPRAPARPAEEPAPLPDLAGAKAEGRAILRDLRLRRARRG